MNYLFAIIIFSFSTYAEEPKDIILKDGSKIINLTEKNSLQPNCKAERNYFEIQNSPNQMGASKINLKIRKDMTVGKKLKPKDCPELNSYEDYTYSNSAKLTGQKDQSIGVQNLVVFPGGSGRYSLNCTSYNLKTGNSLNLKTCLKETTFPVLKEKICQSAKDNPNNKDAAQRRVVADYFCKNALEDAQYCLTDDGISVTVPWYGNWRIIAEIELLKWSDQSSWGKDCDLGH